MSVTDVCGKTNNQSTRGYLKRSDEIPKLNGLLCKGLFFLNQYLRDIAEEQTIYAINAELLARQRRVEERYGSLALRGYRFAIPERTFDYPRVMIELVYYDNIVLESIALGFISDPGSAKDDLAVLESKLAVKQGRTYAALKAYTSTPLFKQILAGLSELDRYRLLEAFRFYNTMLQEPPEKQTGFTLTLLPESVQFDIDMPDNPYRVSIGL